jgi:hypothetical protein
VTPERIAALRALLDDEMRTAVELSDALGEVLDEVEAYAKARARALRPRAGAILQPRTPAERVAAVVPHTFPILPKHREAATELLVALLTAAELNGYTASDFSFVTNLPGACVDLVQARARREARG